MYQCIGQSKSSLKLPKKRTCRKKSSEDGIKCLFKGLSILWRDSMGICQPQPLNIPELKTCLQEHKLKKSDRKNELVERIERHMHK